MDLSGKNVIIFLDLRCFTGSQILLCLSLIYKRSECEGVIVSLRGFLTITSVILTNPQLIFWLLSQKVPSQLSDWLLNMLLHLVAVVSRYTQNSSEGLCDVRICKKIISKPNGALTSTFLVWLNVTKMLSCWHIVKIWHICLATFCCILNSYKNI